MMMAWAWGKAAGLLVYIPALIKNIRPEHAVMYKFLLLKLKMPIWVNSIKIPSGPESPWGILMAET